MNIKRINYISGLIITIFVGLHLINHCFSLLGVEKHIEVMAMLRQFYRNTLIEIILLLAVAVQIFSGLKLFKTKKHAAKVFFEKLQVWTGLYLAVFLVIHVSAVLSGRFILKIDTNFYFGVAGLNLFPYNLFFIPYYLLAVVSFFGHISAIHNQRVTKSIFGITPFKQSAIILIFGISCAFFLVYGMTNCFGGFHIPAEYHLISQG